MRGQLDDGLLRITNDFLTDRTMTVEVRGSRGPEIPFTLGCVQGSVLGPKLFNIYMSQVRERLRGNDVIVYADDTYVAITESDRGSPRRSKKVYKKSPKIPGRTVYCNQPIQDRMVFFGQEVNTQIKLGTESFHVRQ